MPEYGLVQAGHPETREAQGPMAVLIRPPEPDCCEDPLILRPE